MKIENQVATLDQSIRLEQLGVKQEGYFVIGGNKKTIVESWCLDLDEDRFYSCFTVAELGKLLGEYVECVNLVPAGLWRAAHEHATIDKRERNYGTGTTLYETSHDNEASARAALLIYLLESNLITVQEINDRLQSL